MKRYINVCSDNLLSRYGDQYKNKTEIKRMMNGKMLWTSNHSLYEEINKYLMNSLAVMSLTERAKIRRLFGYKLLRKNHYKYMGFKERMKITNLIKVYE